MRDRPFGITVLAFSTIMVALYSQLAALSLLMMGSIFTAAGSVPGVVALSTGAVFLGLAVAAYFVGFGLWTGRHWAWAGSTVVFAVLLGASLFLAIISASLLAAALPAAAAVAAIAYLQRPAVRRHLLGVEPAKDSSAGITERMDAAEPAR